MAEAPEPPAVPRREFLKLVGAAGIATTLPPVASALAQTPPAAGAAADTSKAKAPPKPEGPSDEARALMNILKKRYGNRLTDEEWETVAGGFDNDLASAKALFGVKLANGDEPDFRFKA